MKTIKVIVLILLVVYTLAIGLILWDGITDELQPADTAIVFGAALDKSGGPTPRLQARLNKVIELYSQNYFQKIILSGGTGKNGYNEALAMEEFLLSHNIPDTNIFLDESGENTYSTVLNSSRIMEENDLSSAMVISQFFHIARIKLACRQAGISPVYGVHANHFEPRDLYSILREVIAYGYYYFRSY